VQPLGEPLALLALVVLEDRLRDVLVGRAPAADDVGRQPRVRAPERELLAGQRVDAAQDGLRHLPEATSNSAAARPSRAEPRAVVADATADAEGQHAHARLVEGDVVDAGRDCRIVGDQKRSASARAR